MIFLIVYSRIRHARLWANGPQKLRFFPARCAAGALAHPSPAFVKIKNPPMVDF